jgi:hypothetical protein
MLTRLALTSLLLAVASGCATNLSTLQTGKTLEPGKVRIAAGTGVYLPVEAMAFLLKEGGELAGRVVPALANKTKYDWTAKDEDTVFSQALALAVLPPSPSFELNARVGLFKNFDAGFRYSTNALRLDAKYRVFHADDAGPEGTGGNGRSTDVALGLGGSKYLFASPVLDLLGYVKLDDFSRWDVEATVYLSHDFNKYVGLYAAPKYLYSTTSMDEHLVAATQDMTDLLSGYGTYGATPDVRLPSTVQMHFIGATAGLRVGIPQISLFLELTLGDTIANVKFLGKTRALGGFTAYPAGGLAVSF